MASHPPCLPTGLLFPSTAIQLLQSRTMSKPTATSLSVNINKVATLRNTRPLAYPSPAAVARLALEAGADGITVHPRPDERHIRTSDLAEVEKVVRDFPTAEFNIEGNPFEAGPGGISFEELVRRHKPDQVTLVPDAIGAATSDHGWPTAEKAVRDKLTPMIERLKRSSARVSLFVDADRNVAATMQGAKDCCADRVELYTEPYAADFAGAESSASQPFGAAAQIARAAGLGVNAGHDLTLANLGPFLDATGRGAAGVLEVSIGHALIADALVWGIAETVRRYAAVCSAKPD